jgi:5'-deoxynucleotidase YfbR-like HD superfamily hydrolase
MLKLDELDTLRQAGHVRRFHTELSMSQTNAAHSWHAVTLALILEPALSREAIIQMHMHDVPEVFTGDFPAPVKWEYPELKELLARIEADGERQIGYAAPLLSDYERTLLKFCDHGELVLTCYEYAMMGNRYALGPGFKVLSRMRAMINANLAANERVLSLLATLEKRYDEFKRYKADWR